MFGWLKGYRTYIVAVALVGVQVARAFGIPIPIEVDIALGGTGLATLRSAEK